MEAQRTFVKLVAYLHILLNVIEHHSDHCTQTLCDSTSPSSDFMSAEDNNHAVRHIYSGCLFLLKVGWYTHATICSNTCVALYTNSH